MSIAKIKPSGKLEIAIVVLIILSITILSNFYKELFVEESGSFQLFGNLGILLALGLLQRWAHIRKIVSVWTFVAILGILSGFLLSKSIVTSHLLLVMGLAIVFYLMNFSPGVKAYLDQR